MGKSAFVLLKQCVYLWLLKSLILHSAASRSWRFNANHADIHLTECGLDYISRTRMESRVLKATAGVEFQCQISRGKNWGISRSIAAIEYFIYIYILNILNKKSVERCAVPNWMFLFEPWKHSMKRAVDGHIVGTFQLRRRTRSWLWHLTRRTGGR